MTRHRPGGVWLAVLCVLIIAGAIPALAARPAGPDAAADPPPILADDGARPDNFGAAVATDGSLMLVGAPYATVGGHAYQGAAYLYARDASSPTGWAELRKLTAADGAINDQFGTSVAVLGDYIAVGAPFVRVSGVAQQGAVYIFQRNSGGPGAWGQVARLSEIEVGAYGHFGASLAMDGDLLLVGADGARLVEEDLDIVPGAGLAYLYTRGGWTLVKRLSADSARANDSFGVSVDLDGTTAIVGALRADVTGFGNNDGAAFIFERDRGGPGNWGQAHRMTATDPSGSEQFGAAVALDGDLAVVGAPTEKSLDGTLFSVGAAYAFVRSPSSQLWPAGRRLAASDGGEFDYFGHSVAIQGGRILVGADRSDAGFTDQGKVYAFERSPGGSWADSAQLQASDGGSGDRFGSSIAVDEDVVAVGAAGIGYDRGGVYPVDAGATAATSTAYLPLVPMDYNLITAILEDGGSVRDQSGALLGAVAGALSAPLPVELAAIPAPATPLDAGTAVGAHYRIGAARNVAAPPDSPFLLGLPVPAGVNPATLAGAALTPPGRSSEAGEAAAWETVAGHYDAPNNLFVIALGTLSPQAITVVLSSDPAHEPQPAAAMRPGLSQAAPSFTVTCGPLAGAACTAANRSWLSAELSAAYADFVTGHGFLPPNLNLQPGYFNGTRLEPLLGPSFSFTTILIRTAPCSDSGKYNPTLRQIWVCLPASGTPGEQERRTARHELFHAIQNSYPLFALDRLIDLTKADWVGEGTATAAERSSASMLRSPDFTLHQIASPLTDLTDKNEYSAQDFWVYTGRRLGKPLSYLIDVLAQGATPEHVNNALPLGDAYWSWVKNQIMEKSDPLDGAFSHPPCRVEFNLIGTPAYTMVYQAGGPFTQDVRGSLGPLQSTVVAIEFDSEVSFVTIMAENNGAEADLRYKVYEDAEAGCADVPDGQRDFSSIPAKAERFVVVSNVSLSDGFDFEVQVTQGE